MNKAMLPYGNGHMELELLPQYALLESKIDALQGDRPQDEIVLDAMQNPIACDPLHRLVQGKNTVTLIISDHTRPVPSKVILPHMLRELRRGNPDVRITLLVATGCHRATSSEELRAKLGDAICDHEHIVIHDCDDQDANIEIGILPSGAPLVINRLAVECDLLVSEGFIEPHLFAGFSGGRKSILPGICDRVTVLGNHCGAFIDHPCARPGILDGNPIQRDMDAAVDMAKLAYIVNVIINERKEVVAAFAGHPKLAHRAGCDYLMEYCRVPAVPSDIVVTTNSGAPMDQNLYQAVKGMVTAEATATAGGVIILCAECAEGVGSDEFFEDMNCDLSPLEIRSRVAAVPMAQTRPDQWQTQILSRILTDHTVILVADPKLEEMARSMKMQYASTVDQALEMARTMLAKEATVAVIPNGLGVIPVSEH